MFGIAPKARLNCFAVSVLSIGLNQVNSALNGGEEEGDTGKRMNNNMSSCSRAAN